MDIGMSVTKGISWKVIDGDLMYYDLRFTKSINSVAGLLSKDQYSPEKVSIGYSLGSGFILYIIKNYISLEGTVGVSNFSVGKMKNKTGEFLKISSTNEIVTKAVESGGFSAIIQLNIGFPL